MSFEEQKTLFLSLTEKTLDEVLPSNGVLAEAMRYAVGTGGKRIRPLVAFGAALAVNGDITNARFAAAAIELLHNYTLVHDDLPSMDNDEFRRGKPSVWKKFGEATAILTGDALQALAFDVLTRAPQCALEQLSCLSKAARLVVDGQVIDLEFSSAEAKRNASFEVVDKIYEGKTAALFIAAATMGATAVNATPQYARALSSYAHALGMAFQYEDDLLDNDSPCQTKEETEKRVLSWTSQALQELEPLPGDISFLQKIANKLVGRII